MISRRTFCRTSRVLCVSFLKLQAVCVRRHAGSDKGVSHKLPTIRLISGTSLQEFQGAQIFPRLVEAATAEGCHTSPPVFQARHFDLPFTPGKESVVELKRARIFVL